MSKAKKTNAVQPVLELSTQTLQVLYQCAAQVPANNGQQASLLANALLEVENILQARNAAPPVVEEAGDAQ